MIYHDQRTIPAYEVPMLGVQTDVQLEDALHRLTEDSLPAFVIKASGVIADGLAYHTKTAEKIATLISASTKRPYLSKLFFAEFTLQPEIGEGPLHADADSPEHAYVYNVHTTQNGRGKVTFANSGPEMNALFQVPTSRDNIKGCTDKLGALEKRAEQAHLDLLDGSVDPRIISPVLHVADLDVNDTVIFLCANSEGPVWHRFDTLLEGRYGTVSLVSPQLLSQDDSA